MYIVKLSVHFFIVQMRCVGICVVRNMCVMNLLYKCRTNTPFKNMVFPRVAQIGWYSRRIFRIYNHIKKCASAVFKTRLRRRAKSIHIKSISKTAIGFVCNCTAPHLFYIVYKFLLLTFGVSFATNNNYHIFCVASCFFEWCI